MADARIRSVSSPGGCAHAYTITVGPYTKCTACGEVTPR